MENRELFLIIFGFVGGLFSIAGSIMNWDFFFNSRKASIFLTLFGRTGARIFYALLGVMLIVMAVKMTLEQGKV